MEGDEGFKTPPEWTRFKKGQSGNDKGRPKGRHAQPPYEAVLGRLVTIREDGVERQVTAEDAFLLKLTKSGLEGDSAAARDLVDTLESAKARHGAGAQEPPEIVVGFVAPGSVNTALQVLRMAKKLDPFRETARMALEPWIVEAALARLGTESSLSPAEQHVIGEATRTPHKVKWPGWWSVPS